MNLPPLPTIKEIIKLYNLKARQELSQNFILDLNLATRIARVAGDLRDSVVIGKKKKNYQKKNKMEKEKRRTKNHQKKKFNNSKKKHLKTKKNSEVGPGPGSLTRSLLNLGAKKVIAVEKDARFLPVLEILKEASNGRLEIIHADMLEINEKDLIKDISPESWESEKEKVKIVGNLPFNVATEMLLKWLRQVPSRDGTFFAGRTSLTLLFQREVALRIVAPPGTKEYGRLSVMSQQTCLPEKRFDIVGKGKIIEFFIFSF
jgi:dimethyladenosine transferase 1, mitochondrial